MGFKTKLVVGAVSTVVTLAVASAYGVIDIPTKEYPSVPGNKTNNDEERQVLFTSIWDPSPRREGIKITLLIAGVPIEGFAGGKFYQVAPYHYGQRVRRGMRVEIHAEVVGNQRTLIGCSISVDGIEGDNRVIRDAGPGGKVMCWDLT